MRLSLIVLPKIVLPFLFVGQTSAQFRDDFDKASLALDPTASSGWAFFTGDGSASMDFQQRQGHATILVDATTDQRNILIFRIR